MNPITPIDPFAILSAIFIAVSAAVGFGSAITFIIQIGKLILPKAFPDTSAQNWRIGLILGFTIFLFVNQLVKPDAPVTFEWLDSLMGSFANFGMLIYPLFVSAANWTSKAFYSNVLRGVWKIGKSYSPVKQ